MFPEHLGYGQDHIGGRHPFGNGTGQLETDHPGNQHGNRLAQHGRLGLDAAHTPAQDAQAIHHGGVRVRAHAGVQVGQRPFTLPPGVLLHDHLGQVFDVDLVNDAGSRRYHPEIPEGLLPPAQELITLPVAQVLHVHIVLDGTGHPGQVNLDRMIDDHLGRHLGVDDLRVTTQVPDGITHGGQVDDTGYSSEVLHDHPARSELDFMAWFCIRIPAQKGVHLLVGDVDPVTVPDQVLHKDTQAVWQPVKTRKVGNTVVVELPIPHMKLGQHLSCRPIAHGHILSRSPANPVGTVRIRRKNRLMRLPGKRTPSEYAPCFTACLLTGI